MIRNIRIKLEYDGTNYSGWQIQENAPTVQNEVEKALKKLTGEDISVNGSSRTDAGVHATGFVINFRTESTIPADNFSLALNAFLPSDINAICSDEVPENFHARFDAIRKTYRYLFYPSSVPHALLASRAWHIKSSKFDNLCDSDWGKTASLMDSAAKKFIGFHDFTAFRAIGSTVLTTERTIFDASVKFIPADYFTNTRMFVFEITGDGFLYNMVRIMAGTLYFVMEGKIKPEDIPNIIESKQRKKAGMTAPACGLYLVSVDY